MDKAKQLSLHQARLPDGYMPDPRRHLSVPRDRAHLDWTISVLKSEGCPSLLDVGSWDFWLPAYLSEYDGWRVAGIEPVHELAEAGRRYARAHGNRFAVLEGWPLEQDPGLFSAVSAYEVLEHVELEEVPEYLAWMEAHSTRMVMVSLPLQDHKLNPQHRWTPTEALVADMFKGKKHLSWRRVAHPGDVPANMMVKYEVPRE